MAVVTDNFNRADGTGDPGLSSTGGLTGGNADDFEAGDLSGLSVSNLRELYALNTRRTF